MAIEPSEIITEGNHQQGVVVHPFFRLIARVFDYSLFFAVLHFFGLVGFFSYILNLFPLHFAAWIPVEALLMALWGTTPGKWLMGIQVKKGHAMRVPLEISLKRSFFVWLRGIGAGIPVLNIICALNVYHRLVVLRSTSWDRDLGLSVIHHYLPRWRLWCSVFFTVLLCLIYLIRP